MFFKCNTPKVIDAAAYPTLKNLMTSSGSRLDNKAVGTDGRVSKIRSAEKHEIAPGSDLAKTTSVHDLKILQSGQPD